MKCPDDAQKAIALGVNTPGDSDSIASLAGALVGARTGLNSLPKEWSEKIEDSLFIISIGKQVADSCFRLGYSKIVWGYK